MMIQRLRYALAGLGWACTLGLCAQPVSTTLYVQDYMLYDRCGAPVVLRGVNYPVLDDWNFPATSEVTAEIAQSGANAVRIQWYIDYGQPNRPAYALKDLDTVISRVARMDMVPIVELHDFTCQAGMGELATDVVPWFTQPDVLELIDKHKSYLIINLANEYGQVNWAGNVPAAQTAFQTAYINAVSSLRTAGIDVPIMIDAPDCGTSSNRLVDVSTAIRNADPLRNVIFSVHTYWYAYANNDSVTMRNHLQQMASSGLCFVLGEVANYQDDGSFCTYALHHTAILHDAKDLKLGWLIWSWYKDGCAARQISSNGTFAGLTPYGTDVVHNPVYGLMNAAQKSSYLLNDGCTPAGVEETVLSTVRLYPNPAREQVTLEGLPPAEKNVYALLDITGRTVSTTVLSGSPVQLSVAGLRSGLYTVTRNGQTVGKVLVER